MILCCGEALIDMVPEPTVSGAEGYVPRTGGAIFNTAIGLGRLGCRVSLLSGISSDLFGQQLIGELAASDVIADKVIRSERPTTLAFVRLTNGQASYAFFDENSAGRMIAPDDLPANIDDISALYFGGISLACEPGAETYASFAQQHAQDCVVMLDPNIRPSFIADEGAFRRRIEGMLQLADIVKVSDEDLDWLIPDGDMLEEKIALLRAMGSSIVILTRGGAGAQAWLPDGETVFVSSPKVEVVDTVGAGDTFNAGVLANLYEAGLLSKNPIRSMTAMQLKNALSFGAKVAAINVGRAGANPPWRSEF